MVTSFVTTCCSAEALVVAQEPSGPSDVGLRSMPGPRMTVSPPWFVVIAPAEPVAIPVLPPFPLAGFARAPDPPVEAAAWSVSPPFGEHATNPPKPIDTKRAPLQATRLDSMPQE